MTMRITVKIEQDNKGTDLMALINDAKEVKAKCEQANTEYKELIGAVGMEKVKAIREQLEPLRQAWIKFQDLSSENLRVSVRYAGFGFDRIYGVEIQKDGTLSLYDNAKRVTIDDILNGKSNGLINFWGKDGMITRWNDYNFADRVEKEIKHRIECVTKSNTDNTLKLETTLKNMVEK